MTEKKIAESVNIRVNVGNYQHIELTKYAERVITYDSPEEMIKKEDELTEELVTNLVRNMRRIPEKLGKKTNAVAEVEESITKCIPEWLQNEEVPNLANANGAKLKHQKKVGEQKEQKDAEAVTTEVKAEVKVEPKAEPKVEMAEASSDLDELFDDDLFED